MDQTPMSFVLVIIGLLAIIFRKPYARRIIKSQNSTFGTKFDKDDIGRSANSLMLISVIAIAWGLYDLLGLTEKIQFQVEETVTTILSSLLFIAFGIIMAFYKEKDDRAVIRYEGKIVMIRLGSFSIQLSKAIKLFIALVLFCTGTSELLNAVF